MCVTMKLIDAATELSTKQETRDNIIPQFIYNDYSKFGYYNALHEGTILLVIITQ